MAELLRMPEVAANTPDAVLSSWNVALDTPYPAGTAIVTVETEKAVVDVEADADGVLLRFLVEPGATVEVGTPIAVLGAVGEGAAAVQALLADLGQNAPDAPDVPGSPPAAANGAEQQRIFSSPLARRLARELGVDLGSVVGSGPGGRIRRGDVEAAARSARAAPDLAAAPEPPAAAPETLAAAPETPVAAPEPPAAAGGSRDEPVSRPRAAIARRLTESKQTAPHFYLRGSARVDRLLALRAEVNAGGGPKVSVNDLVIKAVGRAHLLVPALNVTWGGDVVRHHEQVDVAVAVSTGSGLLTPVLRGVERLSLRAVAEGTRDLAERARDRRLTQPELEGGTITVSNLGRYGTEEFAAIINPPHAAILAVGAAREEAVVTGGALAVGQVLRVTLSVDHRPVDGVVAAQWMQVFLRLLENPLQILV